MLPMLKMLKKIFGLSCIAIIIILSGHLLFGEDVFKYNANGKRDPFVPLVSESGNYVSDAYEVNKIGDIRLEGVVWDEGKGSIAIINGEIVKEGDELGSVKVLKIEKDGVIFLVNGQNVKQTINSEN